MLHGTSPLRSRWRGNVNALLPMNTIASVPPYMLDAVRSQLSHKRVGFETVTLSACLHNSGLAPPRSHGNGHVLRVRSLAASLLVWGAAPETACGWGVTPPCRVAQACVNSAPKNRIKAE